MLPGSREHHRQSVEHKLVKDLEDPSPPSEDAVRFVFCRIESALLWLASKMPFADDDESLR